MDVNRPDVVAEVRAVFDAYETVLLANDLDALDAAFWDDDRVVRFAFGTVQLGASAVAAGRRAAPRQTPPRTLDHLTITTYGTDVASVFAVFRLDDASLVHQSQTWVWFGDSWRVTAAHVSSA